VLLADRIPRPHRAAGAALRIDTTVDFRPAEACRAHAHSRIPSPGPTKLTASLEPRMKPRSFFYALLGSLLLLGTWELFGRTGGLRQDPARVLSQVLSVLWRRPEARRCCYDLQPQPWAPRPSAMQWALVREQPVAVLAHLVPILRGRFGTGWPCW